MKKWIITIVLTWMGFTGCTPKAKEIPVEICVRIHMYSTADDAFRRSYKMPEDAPADSLLRFTQPYGYTGEDFKMTKNLINSDEERKKQFNDIHTQLLMEEAMKTLHDDLPDSTKTDSMTTK